MLALDCKPAGAALHLYGYNWSRRHWHSHAIAAEERFVRLLVLDPLCSVELRKQLEICASALLHLTSACGTMPLLL